MWLTYKTIQATINDRNKLENRWHIENEKSIRRIVSDYYRSIKPGANEDLTAYEDAMREAAYAAQDRAIEKLTLTLKNSSNFKSDFERALAIEKLIQAHQLRIENHGWNRSRGNPLVMQQQNNHINIINQNVDNYAVEWNKEAKVKALISKLDSILDD